MPSVNDPRHAQLEQDVRAWLGEKGLIDDCATYHERMRPETISRLSRLDDPTSLYIRTRADRIAVHTALPFSFEWEAKTKGPHRRDPSQGNGVDLTVEAFPLAQHVLKARLGVKILYVYRDQFQGIDCGFWVHRMPEIRDIWLTGRGDGVRGYLHSIWSPDHYDYREITRTGGSGDPYVVFDVATVKALPHWKDQIEAAIRHYTKTAESPEVA